MSSDAARDADGTWELTSELMRTIGFAMLGKDAT